MLDKTPFFYLKWHISVWCCDHHLSLDVYKFLKGMWINVKRGTRLMHNLSNRLFQSIVSYREWHRINCISLDDSRKSLFFDTSVPECRCFFSCSTQRWSIRVRFPQQIAYTIHGYGEFTFTRIDGTTAPNNKIITTIWYVFNNEKKKQTKKRKKHANTYQLSK